MDASLDKDTSLSQLEQKWKALQKSFETFCGQLNEFPHSFHLQNQDSLSNDQLNKVKRALLSALAVGYHTPVETARARNLLAYVYFRLGQHSSALEQADMVLKLEGEHHNVVAIANKAVILWRMGQQIEAQEQVDQLMTSKVDLPGFSYLVVKARAELAYSYTRFSPSFYTFAETLFEDVISAAVGPELWLWKFGLALTRRRMLPLKPKEASDEDKFRSVLGLHLEIIGHCASNNLKAKAYAEIALLINMVISTDFKEILQNQAGLSVEKACSLALECDSDDNSVLWKCGKIYRYLRKTDKSCDLLKKAVSLRATSKGYHHLGLTFKALANREKCETQRESTSQNDLTEEDKEDRLSEKLFQQFNAQFSRSASFEPEGHQDQIFTSASKQPHCHQDQIFTSASKQPHCHQDQIFTSASKQPHCHQDQIFTSARKQPHCHQDQIFTSASKQPRCHQDQIFTSASKQPHRHQDLISTSANKQPHCHQDVISPSESRQSQSHQDQVETKREASDPEDGAEPQVNKDRPTEGKALLCTPPSDTSYRTADKSTKETFRVWKIVKSPLNSVTGLTRGDAYVDDAIDSLARAVELSEWENTAAAYDLALIYRSTGEHEWARYYLERSLSKQHSLRHYNKINVFEQLGLTYADMARESVCEKESERLTEKSQSMLLMALKTAAESYSKVLPIDERHIGGLWHSFPALMESVNKKDDSSAGKLRDKARLFQLIRKNKTSLAILQDIEKMDPQKGNDPEHLKLCIENYVEMHRFEEALVFVDLLQCTSQHEKAMELFGDKQFLQKIYLHAAKQSLQRGSPNFKLHFKAVFDHLNFCDSSISSAEGTSSEAEEGTDKKPMWNVHILHEEIEEDISLAQGLVSVLTDVCGLRATRMDDDIMGGFCLEGVFDIMRKSKVVVVMAGGQKLSSGLRYFINIAARRSTSVTLQIHGSRVPKLMKIRRSMDLPSELFHVTSPVDPGKLSSQKIAAICDLLGFLADVQVKK